MTGTADVRLVGSPLVLLIPIFFFALNVAAVTRQNQANHSPQTPVAIFYCRNLIEPVPPVALFLCFLSAAYMSGAPLWKI